MNASDSWYLWEALAGLTFFLLGMDYMEEQLKQLAGRRFKLFVRRQSSKKLGAIGSAAIVTGLLQSSSVVNMIILAFVGAGITGMNQALTLMLGSNIGTTLSTWFVATVGFKFNLAHYALPFIAVAGLVKLGGKKNRTLTTWSNVILGLAFLIFGLEMMKNGASGIVNKIDLSSLSHYPSIIFLLTGILITAIIQSSSATAAIALSALHAHALNIHEATAIVLGAEVGTTIKLILASLNGPAVQKRVATGNFLYNVIVVCIIFPVLGLVNYLIAHVIDITDPLLALAFFQTMVNVIGTLLFLPFLNIWSRLLQRLYTGEKNHLRYIQSIPPAEIEFAITALQKETTGFIFSVIAFSRQALSIGRETRDILYKDFLDLPEMEQYEYIKHLHGDILGYCLDMQHGPMLPDQANVVNRLMGSARNAMYAAKSIKDAMNDIEQLNRSGNDTKYNFLLSSKTKADEFYTRLADILGTGDKEVSIEQVTAIYKLIQDGYEHTLRTLYKEDVSHRLNEVEISTIMNFNRELYTSFKSLVFSIKDGFLQEKEAARFDELPGFVR